jgi:carboxypeptidase C (cathepsin A)
MTTALFLLTFLAQQPVPVIAPPPPLAAPVVTTNTALPPVDEKPVVTRHEITVGGKTLRYTVNTGMMPIRNPLGELEAHIFFMAYTLDDAPDKTKRPLMFSFNGGPGSSSVWLHMGAIGPKRVRLNDDGSLPPAPYQLVDNEATWLDKTDLVFIDPVGTGFSRAVKPELAKKFYGVQGDLESVGEFIRMYLNRFERSTSPLFLVGESYGTTRAANLSGYMFDQGITFNGVILLSTVLNFQTILFTDGNDLPYMLYMPSYAATAWYHKKLKDPRPLPEILKEVETWSVTGYAEALARGDSMTPQQRQDVIAKIAHYTGLDPKAIDRTDLRVSLGQFMQELLQDEKQVSGRLDSRLLGAAKFGPPVPFPESDPSMDVIRPPYTALFMNYVRADLGYKSDSVYHILGGAPGLQGWDWGSANHFLDVSPSLRSAFAKNPHMKLFMGRGYYDMATPYFGAFYTLTHMGLPAAAHRNITVRDYEAGHMFYIHKPSLLQLKQDVTAFIGTSL